MSQTSAPISIVGLTEYMGIDQERLSNSQLSGDDDGNSEANTLATLPSFLGEYEVKTKIILVPQSQQITPSAKDTTNLQAILSAPITATLPLADFLKVKPKLWEYMVATMTKQGFALTNKMIVNETNKEEINTIQQVPFNKVNSYQDRTREMLHCRSSIIE